MVNGETQMKYAGNTTMRSIIGSERGLADLKKTFIYNQKLTTGLFEILEDNPDKNTQARDIALKVE